MSQKNHRKTSPNSLETTHKTQSEQIKHQTDRRNQVLNKRKEEQTRKQKNPAITYSHIPLQDTTIGSSGLNERVRNGNVCFPWAYRHQAKYQIKTSASDIWRNALQPNQGIRTTNNSHKKNRCSQTPGKSKTSAFFDCSMNTAKNHTAKVKNINSLGTLVVFSSMRHRTHTYTLSTRSSFWILTSLRLGNLILELAWRLDAFSAYPSRT